MKYKSFHPGQPWLDTNGKRIHAHGGSIFYENGRYYWYGENGAGGLYLQSNRPQLVFGAKHAKHDWP